MEENTIICPHCKEENEPQDNEDYNIGFTSMTCEHCDEPFYMSRTIIVSYDTWA